MQGKGKQPDGRRLGFYQCMDSASRVLLHLTQTPSPHEPQSPNSKQGTASPCATEAGGGQDKPSKDC